MDTDRTPPPGYEPPTEDSPSADVAYYLAPQPDYDGATPLFIVVKRSPGEQHILAEKCYALAGVEIVDALRFSLSHSTV